MTKIYLTSLLGQDIFCHPIKSNLILVSKSFKPSYDESHEVTLNFRIYLEAALSRCLFKWSNLITTPKNPIDIMTPKSCQLAIKFNHYEIVEVVKLIRTISLHAGHCINSACICISIILTIGRHQFPACKFQS